MNIASRVVPGLFAFAALGLFAQGVVEARRPRIDPTTWLTFDAETKSFGAVPERTLLTVKFRATNIGPTPLHLMGSLGSCSPQGCVKALRETSVIPPGASIEIEAHVGARAAGAFSNELVLFTDCPGRARLPLVVTGTILEPLLPTEVTLSAR